ncbi:MAG: phosphoribosylaminoimidazolesuccinocarboxamide synthase [Planctomycetaceae bacterium]|nr:phosphoribosylaminoimidazolesuccinocarboxamide synthase [Planctomycetaceae bacterium]
MAEPQKPLLQSDIPGIPVRRGKVRDVYDFGDRLLFVATDRISAFDYILPNGIPRKGEVLTRMSRFWFSRLTVTSHLLDDDLASLPIPDGVDISGLAARSMVVRKTNVVPVECVVRGYLAGSGLKEYRTSQKVCGVSLPAGLMEGSQLPEPIFTPATKAESGHDENIPFETMCDITGQETAERLRSLSLDVYRQGAEIARSRGILIADTKFEFGLCDDQILLIDEVMTPDSSRFWPADQYHPGQSQPSFDKQFVRDWLESSGWDKNSPPPVLPEDVVERTAARYIEAYERLTGQAF